jgi:hypothetical protein
MIVGIIHLTTLIFLGIPTTDSDIIFTGQELSVWAANFWRRLR